MNFQDKVDAIITKSNSLVCVGLDSDYAKLPESIKSAQYPQFEFNKAIVDATHDLVCAYKPNSAFYEARGSRGIDELKMTFDYINQNYPEIITILDAKRGDIGNTNNGYIRFAYDYLGADSITLHPYLGSEAIKPFLDRTDKGAIILCRTSNPGAGELQDLPIADETLYERVAKHVANSWNANNNCMLVVGATYPEELATIRKITKDMTFLVPGIGAQGGDVEKTVKSGLNSKNAGMIINSSRGIIFASNGTDFAEKAREETEKLKTEINKYRHN
ncbi:MAG TPA: orotidine-5'-phosphate decarboxylase [Patescibacteria group bacterium]